MAFFEPLCPVSTAFPLGERSKPNSRITYMRKDLGDAQCDSKGDSYAKMGI